MEDSDNKILNSVKDYYSAKIKLYGPTSFGVDWNSEEGQLIRFEQLLKIVQIENDFSIVDVGCGYGALIDLLQKQFKNYNYIGVDISEDMISSAKTRYGQDDAVQFHVSTLSPIQTDYGVASGIFNVRLQRDDDQWWSYLTNTLDRLNETTNRGFSFNCLTRYSDADRKRNYLYYADPCRLFDWCKRKYSNQVALLHDYGLYEFTILVRK
jgi:SAM-dependent methyltransferase